MMAFPRSLPVLTLFFALGARGATAGPPDVARRPAAPLCAGAVEIAARGRVAGWAYDPGAPSGTASVKVQIDDGPVQTLRADAPAPAHGELGPDPHGWALELHDAPASARPVRVRVWVAGAPDDLPIHDAVADLRYPAAAGPPVRRKVCVVALDPMIGGKRLHERMGWPDPRRTTDQLIAELRRVSGGRADYEVASWRYERAPGSPYFADAGGAAQYATALADGQRAYGDFTAGRTNLLQYLAALITSGFSPIAYSPAASLFEMNAYTLAGMGFLDEVWYWVPPMVQMPESATAGYRPFPCPGPPLKETVDGRLIVVMGFHLDQDAGGALHTYAHRAEAVLAAALAADGADRWPAFIAPERTKPGNAGLGSVHVPANSDLDDTQAAHAGTGLVSEAPLDLTSRLWVDPHAARWPGLALAPDERIARVTWGGPDPALEHVRWWLATLPRGGAGDDWWRWVADPDQVRR